MCWHALRKVYLAFCTSYTELFCSSFFPGVKYWSPHTQYPYPVLVLWPPQHRRDKGIVECVQPRARKVLKDKHHPVCREWLGALWLFSSEEKAQGILSVDKYLYGGHRGDRTWLPGAGIGATGHKIKWEFSSKHQETFFLRWGWLSTCRVWPERCDIH